MAKDGKNIILYADDDIDDHLNLQECLTSSSLELVHLYNGIQVMETLQQGIQPELIVTDVNMNLMNGLQLLICLRRHQEYQHIPVVLFTTSDSDNDRSFAKQWGALFITKPLTMEELRKIGERLEALAASARKNGL